MKIEFKWVIFEEDDDKWEALFVKTSDKDWHLASQEYNTEDETIIRRNIIGKKRCEIILEEFLRFLEEAGIKIPEIKPYEDICDFDSPWGIELNGISVMSDENFNKFEVGYAIYDPGSRWEPPSEDYCEHSKEKGLAKALFVAHALSLNFQFQGWSEAQIDTSIYEGGEEEV